MKKLIRPFLVVLLLCALLPGNGQYRAKYPNYSSVTEFGFIAPELKHLTLPGGQEIHYAEHGDESGIPVVFIHGFTDSWHSYESVMALLPENVHAFAITLRGHGQSGKPATGYHPKDFAGDVAAFIKKLNIGPVFVVGHSMGGVIAQQLVIDQPRLISGLILISTAAAFGANPGLSEFLNEIAKQPDPVTYSFAADFQKSTITIPINERYLDTLIGESLKTPRFVWTAALQELMRTDLLKKLRSVKKPVMVLWGDRDQICSRVDQDKMLRALPRATLTVYNNTGHALHWEQPVHFVADLITFITSVNAQ